MKRDDLDYEKIKELLLSEKNKLEMEFSKFGRRVSETGDWMVVPEPSDQETPEFDESANKIEDFESNISILTVLEEQYNDVIKALEKIKEGVYGFDEQTKEPISAERLYANPSAKNNL